MEVVHQFIDGKILSQVITLPKPMQEMLVEIVVKPAKKNEASSLSRSELSKLLRGSHTESLTGALVASDNMTLKELRAERRLKYERID